MRYVIFGGGGFIGRNLILLLLADGESEVVSFDKREDFGSATGSITTLAGQRLTHCIGDINEVGQTQLRKVVGDADAVVHLAAISGIRECARNLTETVSENIMATARLLQACEATGCQGRFVFASSGAVLAGHSSGERPLHESFPRAPITAYGASKSASEELCEAAWREKGVPATSLRFSNVYGMYSEEKTSVVHAFCRAAARGEPLQIHGNGSQKRDFIFVDDLCRAIISICESRKKRLAGIPVNVSSGEAVSISGGEGSIASMVRRSAPEHTTVTERRDVSPGVSYSSLLNKKLFLLTGWKPETKLEEGIFITQGFYNEYEGFRGE